MADRSGLKVFISWSGDLAKEVAIRLRDLLPVIFDGVEPWMSDHDIEAGSRGLEDIARELGGTSFGIIVVTNENQGSKWLNFEAGALSKRVDDEGSVRVVPLLVDLDSGAELTGPMTQFQWKLLERSGVRELLIALAGVIGVTTEVVDRRLAAEWAGFEAAVKEARSKTRHPSAKPRRSVESMMEETLELVRAIANDSGRVATIDSKRGRFTTAEVIYRAATDTLSRWGKNLDVEVLEKGGRIQIDVADPDGRLDVGNSELHAAIEASLHRFGLQYVHLVVNVNGKQAIPF